MKRAYALLGLSFLIVFGGAYVLYERAHAPGAEDQPLRLTSTAFNDGETIPAAYTCDAENISPPLRITGGPDNVVSYVLLVEDPDIPEAVKAARDIEVFEHWTLYDINHENVAIYENVSPSPGTEGRNSRGELGYAGPCPPPDLEPKEHQYIFTVYALAIKLDLPTGATHAEVRAAMEGHVLASASLMGRYQRQAANE